MLPSGKVLETILLVESNPNLRKHLKEVLEHAFTVCPVASAKEAVRLEAEFPGTIDLLLTDLRMPGTTGPSLAKKLQERRPHMRVMILAGFPGGALLIL